MSIEIGSLEDRDELKNYLEFEPTEHVNARQDKETVLKTKSLGASTIATPHSNFQPQPLTGRVGDPSQEISISHASSPIDVEDDSKEIEAPPPRFSPEEQLLEMNPEDLRAIERELIHLKTNPPEPYYQAKLLEVVEKMLTLHIKRAEEDVRQKKGQKNTYSESNKKWGEYQKEMGDRRMNFTWAALGFMALQFVPAARPTETDIKFLTYFSQEGCKNLAEMFNSEAYSRQKMVEGVAQIAMAEINAMMNKDSSSESSKQAPLGALEKANEAQRRAAQAGG